MLLLDRDIEHAEALVIDGNPSSRSIIVSQLRDLGVPKVVQAARLIDGRRRLEIKRYDIVVCEQQFAGHDQTGQELLDDLRRSQLLPYSTVFVMLTGEARYAQVAEAAESALDCYLLKPYSTATLADRLRQARHRKRVLKDIFEAIETDRFEDAARLCLTRFEQRGEFWLYAARIGAELLLRVGRHDQAQKLYTAIIEFKTVPWAKLGVARAQADGGETASARRTLEGLVDADPDFADAYDVMGRVQLDRGQFPEALDTYRRAASITPGSIARLQKQGMLAFYLGEDKEAETVLDRATLLGISSKMYDAQTLVLLAFARFRLKDSKGLRRCRENLDHLCTRQESDHRVTRFARVVQTLEHLSGKQLAQSISDLSDLATQRRQADFDVEAACNLLCLMATLASNELNLDGMEGWVSDLALRFSTSKSVNELLTRSAAAHPSFVEIIGQGHVQLAAMSESSMSHALEGDPRTSVTMLLEHAEHTLNAKLVDTAKRTLMRYRAQIDDAPALEARITALTTTYASSWAAPRLGQNGRSAGGLTLRDGSPAAQSRASAEPKTEIPAPPATAAA